MELQHRIFIRHPRAVLVPMREHAAQTVISFALAMLLHGPPEHFEYRVAGIQRALERRAGERHRQAREAGGQDLEALEERLEVGAVTHAHDVRGDRADRQPLQLRDPVELLVLARPASERRLDERLHRGHVRGKGLGDERREDLALARGVLGSIEQTEAASAEQLAHVVRDRAVAEAHLLVGKHARRLAPREDHGRLPQQVRAEDRTVPRDALVDELEGLREECERLSDDRKPSAARRRLLGRLRIPHRTMILCPRPGPREIE